MRPSSDPHLRSVEARRNDAGGGWSVGVAAMTFVRAEHAPYEELRDAIENAIKSVPGANEIEREHDGGWWVTGSPSGEDLVRAVSHVIDEHADRLRGHYNNVNA